uniref:Protein kinase domain-containing protein n=1 Tax=Oryza brachyantha TaxID=4533 RepID=J3N0Z2_ORYBR
MDPHPTGVPSLAGGAKWWRYDLGSADDYERLDVVGQGTFGVVFRARDHRNSKNIALKCLLERLRQGLSLGCEIRD